LFVEAGYVEEKEGRFEPDLSVVDLPLDKKK
jgi:hypothetical protein